MQPLPSHYSSPDANLKHLNILTTNNTALDTATM